MWKEGPVRKLLWSCWREAVAAVGGTELEAESAGLADGVDAGGAVGKEGT